MPGVLVCAQCAAPWGVCATVRTFQERGAECVRLQMCTRIREPFCRPTYVRAMQTGHVQGQRAALQGLHCRSRRQHRHAVAGRVKLDAVCVPALLFCELECEQLEQDGSEGVQALQHGRRELHAAR